MKQNVPKIIFRLLCILASLHAETDCMLKNNFFIKELLEQKGTPQAGTPPSPISPISPGSYPQKTHTFFQKKNLTQSEIQETITKKTLLANLLNHYNTEKEPHSPQIELELYLACRHTIENCDKTFSCKKLLEYIKQINKGSKTLIPQVIVWAALDTFLTEKKVSLESIITNNKDWLKTVEDLVQKYQFPTRYIGNQTYKMRPKKNTSFDSMFLSPTEKLFTTVGKDLYFHGLEKKQQQKLTIKTTKHNTVKIGNHVKFDPTGKYAIIYAANGPVTLWDLSTEGACVATIYDEPKENRTIKDVLTSNEGKQVVILFTDGSYLMLDTSKKLTLNTITKGISAEQATLSADGNLLAIDTKNCCLWVTDHSKKKSAEYKANKILFPKCTNEESLYSLYHPDKKISQLAFDPKSQYIAVVTEDSNNGVNLLFCDLTKDKKNNNQPILEWELPEKVSLMAFSPQGKYLAISYKNSFINICAVGKKGKLSKCNLPFGAVTHLVFDRDETSLLIGMENGSAAILHLKTGDIEGVLKHSQPIASGCFTNRWPLFGISTITKKNSFYHWGKPVCDVSLLTYLILKYLPAYQAISIELENSSNNTIRFTDKNCIKNINQELEKFICSLVAVQVKKEPNTKQLVLWISDKKPRIFLGPDGNFLPGLAAIKKQENWFNSAGKSSIN